MQSHSRLNSASVARPASGIDTCQNDAKIPSENPSGNSRSSKYSNSDPVKGMVARHPRPRTRSTKESSVSEDTSTRPSTVPSIPLTDITSRTKVDSSWNFLNTSMASPIEERMFVLAVKNFGPKTAVTLAAKFHWKCQRPLQELRAAMNARGKNYSARSAKRKRPSGVAASSRKRSSGA